MIKFPSLLLATFFLSTALYADKVREDSSTTTTKIIKQNGTIQKVTIANTKYRNNSINYGVIIKFVDEELLDIEALEAKYNLIFQKKLSIGYYVFKNNSTQNDMDIIEKMIYEEKNIDTIKQNAPLKAKRL